MWAGRGSQQQRRVPQTSGLERIRHIPHARVQLPQHVAEGLIPEPREVSALPSWRIHIRGVHVLIGEVEPERVGVRVGADDVLGPFGVEVGLCAATNMRS